MNQATALAQASPDLLLTVIGALALHKVVDASRRKTRYPGPKLYVQTYTATIF